MAIILQFQNFQRTHQCKIGRDYLVLRIFNGVTRLICICAFYVNLRFFARSRFLCAFALCMCVDAFCTFVLFCVFALFAHYAICAFAFLHFCTFLRFFSFLRFCSFLCVLSSVHIFTSKNLLQEISICFAIIRKKSNFEFFNNTTYSTYTYCLNHALARGKKKHNDCY